MRCVILLGASCGNFPPSKDVSTHMRSQLASLLLLVAIASWTLGQETPAAASPVPEVAATDSAPTLSNDQIRELIRQVAEKDMENDKKLRDYTYVDRVEEHRL